MYNYLNSINIFYFSIFLVSLQIIIYLKIRKIPFIQDNDTSKQQAVHLVATPRIGGILVLLGFLLLFFKNSLNQDKLTFIMFYFIIVSFVIGFLDDCKLVQNPFTRFFFFIFSYFFLVYFFNYKIENFSFILFDKLNRIYLISLIITTICIFAVTNGANIIDGFNGLLLINVININFFYIILAYVYNDIIILEYCIYFFIICIIPSFLNFPKSKIFMGDSGAYVCGVFLAIIGIELNKYSKISPFYIAILLSYFFFEIFFSIVRKLLQKKNPFKPDINHLHLLVFRYLKKKNYKNNNFLTSILICTYNLLFFTMGFFFYYNYLITKIIFIMYIVSYSLIYYYLNKKVN